MDKPGCGHIGSESDKSLEDLCGGVYGNLLCHFVALCSLAPADGVVVTAVICTKLSVDPGRNLYGDLVWPRVS